MPPPPLNSWLLRWGYTIYNWCSKTNRCASQNWDPLTFQNLLGEVFCTLPYDTDGSWCCLLWRRKGWVTVGGEYFLTPQCWGSWTMMARGHLTGQLFDKIDKRRHWNHEIPGVASLSRSRCCWNCREWLMLLFSMESLNVAGVAESKFIDQHELGTVAYFWWGSVSLWTLHMTCVKAIHHSAHWPISPPVTDGKEFFGTYVSPRINSYACVCLWMSQNVCNEGWFSTPGEAREVWAWPSLAVGEKYHLHREEVIGCLRLSSWLIVGRNS